MHRAQADSRNPHRHSRRSSPAVLRSTLDWDHTGNWPEAHLLFLPLLPRQVLAQGKQGAGGIHQHSLSAPWSTQCLLCVHTGICPVSAGIALPGKRLPPCFVLQLVNVTLELFPQQQAVLPRSLTMTLAHPAPQECSGSTLHCHSSSPGKGQGFPPLT